MFEYAITELSFSGGETIAVEGTSLLTLIGANNCGKTHALRDISGHLGLKSRPTDKFAKVVTDVATSAENGAKDALLSWLASHYMSYRDDHERLVFSVPAPSRHSVTANHVPRDLSAKAKLSGQLAPFIVHELDTTSRLSLVNSCSSIDVYSQPPTHYIHTLQADEERLERISREVRAAFDADLIINWGRGGQVGLHLGDEPSRSRENDRVSRGYVTALEALPRIEDEGDGIKSFVGCLLGVMCGAHKILLIDEPEAFLHPPQARRLGRLLAENATALKRQIIIATHSSDVVLGAMSSPGKVTVCRMNRSDNENHAHILGSNELRDLWSKPLLKSSDAVAGIFHQGVIVCEADADCRFYESILTRLDNDGTLTKPADLHFVHGSGKGELAPLAQSYKQLQVPVAVVADFDVLRTRGELEKLVGVLGGDLSNVKGDYNSATTALADQPPITDVCECVSKLRDLADTIESRRSITNTDRKTINALLAATADWSEAKKHGITKLKGGAYKACERVLAYMQTLGLFIVPEGQMESWDRSLSADKSEWIQQALDKIDSDLTSFDNASGFLRQVAAFLGIESSSPADDVGRIIETIDDEIIATGKEFLTPPEANAMLERKGLLRDSEHRPGLSLRKLLREGRIPHAFQVGGKGTRWRIPHSKSEFR